MDMQNLQLLAGDKVKKKIITILIMLISVALIGTGIFLLLSNKKSSNEINYVENTKLLQNYQIKLDISIDEETSVNATFDIHANTQDVALTLTRQGMPLTSYYLLNYETGEVIPMELVGKIKDASKFGQGFATVEYLAASYLDMDFHNLKEIPADLDVEAFETKVLSDRGLLPQIPPRYRSTYFNHTFGGGYTAGYYSYIWAEVLDADAYNAYKESGDIFNQEVASKFRKEILEKAGSDDAMTLYMNFRGKEPDIEPLLINRGLK